MKTYGFAEFHRHFSDNTLDFNHGHIGILVVWVTGIVMFQQPYKMVNIRKMIIFEMFSNTVLKVKVVNIVQ